MGRRRGRQGRGHSVTCVCAACLDRDARKLDAQLDAAFEKRVKEQISSMQIARIQLSQKEVPVVGPYDGDDLSKAMYTTCPTAIVGKIVPLSRRRK